MNRSRRNSRRRVPDSRQEARLERRFVWGLTALILFVAILQVSLRFDTVRRFLNESIRLEGVPLVREIEGLAEPQYPWLDMPVQDAGAAGQSAPTGTIYLRFLRRPKGEVWVLVNSRAVKALDKDGGTVTVRDGDFVEVLSRYGEVQVLVSEASPNVQFPGTGTWVTGSGHVLLARVRLK